MSERPDYTIERAAGSRTVAFAGVIRLESTEAYERLFQPLRSEMTASKDRYTLDVSAVVFMNSSGIRAVAELVLAAKQARIPLTIRSDAKSPWQKKTLASLRFLDSELELEARAPGDVASSSD